MSKGRKKVLIAFSMAGSVAPRKLAGIFRYLSDSRPWELTLLRTIPEFTEERIREALNEGYDGFIISSPGPTTATALLAKTKLPIVVMDIHDTNFENRSMQTVTIRHSAEEIGKAAANTLLSSGSCRSFAFVNNTYVAEWSDERLAAFRKRLQHFGRDCTPLDSPEGLEKLERPVGVLAAHDDEGLHIIDFCDRHGLRIPQDIQLLGINNNVLICENCRPTLSSVQPDFEQEGFLSAQILDRMMAARNPTPSRTVFVGVKQVVRRNSTGDATPAGILVYKALDYLKRHATEGIDACAIARHFKCSRRLLDLRFRETLGQTVGERIVQEQLAAAKTLLATTHDTLATIATKCGYDSSAYLMTKFKRTFGCTMAAYRRAQQIKTTEAEN